MPETFSKKNIKTIFKFLTLLGSHDENNKVSSAY
jgi:hypothetical protein